MKKIIVDANFVVDVFKSNVCSHPKLRTALVDGRGYRIVCVLGGYLRVEYNKIRSLVPIFSEMRRSGKLTLEDDLNVDNETKALKNSNLLVSDDPHIVALARVSGARVLCSYDQELHQDFTNINIISNPRGRVYQNEEHCHLLR